MERIDTTTSKNRRIVYAPDVTYGHKTTAGPMSVSLEEGDEVIWTWTNGVNGERYVSGYTIIKKGIKK